MNTHTLSKPWWLLPPGRLAPRWWAGIAALLVGLDYVAGLNTQFPTGYVIPVALAAWYSGRRPALILAVGLPLAHILLLVLQRAPSEPLVTPVVLTIVRGMIIFVMGLWFARLSEHERALQRHVQTLEGLLPICVFCKNIRNEAGDWEHLEKFVSTRSAATFSHSFCPSCAKAQYGDLFTDDASNLVAKPPS